MDVNNDPHQYMIPAPPAALSPTALSSQSQQQPTSTSPRNSHNNGNITPLQVQQHRQHASNSSNVKSNLVAVNLFAHVEKAESNLAAHKKHYTAVTLTISNLSEALLQLSKKSDEVKSLWPSTELPNHLGGAYDATAQQAMRSDESALNTLNGQIQALNEELKSEKSQLEDLANRLRLDMAFLKDLITRDSAIQTRGAGAKVRSGASDNGSVLPALKQSQLNGTSSSSVTGQGLTNYYGPDPTRWIEDILESQRLSIALVRRASERKTNATSEIDQGMRRQRALRNDVVRGQATAIFNKSQHRLKLQTDAALIRKKLDDTRELWQSTVVTVKKMKKPMQSSEDKFHQRDDVPDQVGNALTNEKEDLAKSRHELKKLARDLGEQAEDLERQYLNLLEQLRRVDGELDVETKRQVTAERFNLLSPRHDPREDKQRAIRTFPTLGQTSRDNGMSLSSSSLRSPGGGSLGGSMQFQGFSPRQMLKREHGGGMYMPLPPGVALDPVTRTIASSQSPRVAAPLSMR